MRTPEAAGAGKVHAAHLDRLAVVYVRQSTPQQVLDHQESTRLQYGLRSRAHSLGWAADRVVVIDDDLGKSGTSTAGRAGFQRLVSEVGLGHVGLILGIEMSRLARSCADWHQLLELCALFSTLIADSDGIYDSSNYNDRLLLGLKGTMSEAELHIMQQRLRQGLLAKARRGALAVAVPIGYMRRPSGEVVFDPDAQVQHVVRLVFRKFEELGTLHAVLRYLAVHQVQVGVRLREGPNRGELEWRRPNRMTLQNLLKNPIYAYGRRQVDRRRKQPGRPQTGRVVQAPEAWLAFVPDQCPAYISWDQYERNLARLAANRARAGQMGAIRGGPALLAGLVVCGRCGTRMGVSYKDGRQTYQCTRHATDYGAPMCQQLAGAGLEQWVSAQVLAALAPAALELSLTAAQHLAQERADLLLLWQQRRERACYEAERAARHYRALEPEHRLVARQLAQEWEAKLAAQQHLEEDYRRFLQGQPAVLSQAEQAAIRELAADIPALWSAPSTTAPERKAILRQVVERVAVQVQGGSERVQVTIVWAGGAQTGGEVVRPVACLASLSYYAALCQRVRALAAAGHSALQIADSLNHEGYRPPNPAARFGARGVREFGQRLGVWRAGRRRSAGSGLHADEWWPPELAYALGMPRSTLYTWVLRGWITAHRQERPAGRCRWVLWADQAELARLRLRYQQGAGATAHTRWLAAPADAAAGNAQGG